MDEPDGQLDVLHVTPRLGKAGGGVWNFVRDLAAAQATAGLRVAVAGLDDGPGSQPFEVLVAPSPNGLRRTLAYSGALGRMIDGAARRSRVIHAHGGLRMWPNVQVRRAAAEHRRPTVLSPHGSLYPWMLRRNRLRKAIAGALFDRRSLRSVDRFHATCEQEASFIRDRGLTQPIDVIPPGVNPVPIAPPFKEFAGDRVALFVGIFDRKKGLLRLVRAWKSAASGWRLLLAGPDQDGHAAEVRAEVQRLGLNGRVILVGPQYGEHLAGLYARAELFVLPTDWENFGLVVGEALSAGVPVVTTTNTPWDWLPREHAGWFIDGTEAAVTAAIRQATALPPAELRAMGERGRRVVLDRYDWSRTVEALDDVYRTAAR